MTLVQYKPFKLMYGTRKPVNVLPDQIFDDNKADVQSGTFMPPVDIYEKEKNYHIDVALPGFKKEEIRIEFKKGKLTVSGAKEIKQDHSARKYHRLETIYGRFVRTFSLGDDVNRDQLEARFEDGMLKIKLAKKEKHSVRRIKIK